ncbi:zinc finger protein 385D isoform X2 [Sardina pilchardus]
MRPPLPTAMQSALGIKQFLPFSLEPPSGVSLFPSFSAMDPVQKAVIHHTFGVAPSPKRKYISCGVCQLRFNSQSQALAHFKGTKHAKKLKALDSPKCKQKGLLVARETSGKETPRSFSPAAASLSIDRKDGILAALLPPMPASLPLPLAPPPASGMGGGSGVDGSPAPASSGDDGIEVSPGSPANPPPTPEEQTTAGETEGEAEGGEAEKEAEAGETETEEEKAKRLLYCSLCKVAVNSPSQLEAHNSGTKHKTMLEARSGTGSIKSFPRAGVKAKVPPPPAAAITGLQNKTFHCETCDVHVNSETQLKQHISSRRHKDRAAGKPAKPKYSPYTKPPRGQTKQQPGKLSLSKEMCPTLPAGLMPTHLAAMAAAAAAINSAFPMRSSANPSLFQTQSLPAALLRPAPGPVRTAHTPVLFAPY